MAHATLDDAPSGHRGSALLDRPPIRIEPSTDPKRLIERFEQVYRQAQGDPSLIPWAHRESCPWLESWLNVEAPNLVRPGARVVVVGCGLGNDAAAMVQRGYDVTAFDVCPSAVEWARRGHPECADLFVEADLLNLPPRFQRRFDLVVEVHTIQSLPPSQWERIAQGLASLASAKGIVLAIARGRDESEPLGSVTGPPFPLTHAELVDLMHRVGLEPVRPIDDFEDDNDPPVRRLRGAFRRSR